MFFRRKAILEEFDLLMYILQIVFNFWDRLQKPFVEVYL